MDTVNGPEGRRLWERADRVLPGGAMYLSRSARFAGDDVQPGFIARAEGCRVVDVDGRSYIDFLCANGPNLLGYRHPEVEEATRQQALESDAASYFPPALVELAERLVDRTPGVAFAIPAKHGSDVVTLAVRAARAATGRDKIVLFVRAYHGFDPEWVPGSVGVPASRQAEVLRVGWNEPEALERVAAANADAIAAIVLNPLDQNPGMDALEPTRGFLDAIARVRERTGARLIVDDVRCGFRLHPTGSHVALGVEPDLICLGKALGNGYSVSALLGREPLREAAARLMFTATSVFGAVAMRAALATLRIYERDNAFGALERAGERLRSGLLAAAKDTGHDVRYTGPATMPVMLFEDDPDLSRGRRFSREAARRGALFHPNLNWFVSAAHDDAAIDDAVAIAHDAFRATPLP